MPTDRDDRLAQIYERARTLRNRRRALWSGTGAAVVVVAVLAITLTRGDDHRSGLTTLDGGTTTSTTESIVTTTVVEPVVEETTTSTTEPPVCRNSFDPRCGKFRYDPPLDSLPPPKVNLLGPPGTSLGREVVYNVEVSEIFGSTDPACGTLVVTRPDGSTMELPPTNTGGCSHADPSWMNPDNPQPHGPWDPPTYPDETLVYRFVPTAVGSYSATYRFQGAEGFFIGSVYEGDGPPTSTTTSPPG